VGVNTKVGRVFKYNMYIIYINTDHGNGKQITHSGRAVVGGRRLD